MENQVYSFESMAQILAHPDVMKQIELRAGEMKKDSEVIKEIALKVPIEVLKGREDLKVYLERASKEDLLKSLKVEEVAALSLRDADTMDAVLTALSAKQTKMTEFRGKARPLVIQLGIPEGKADDFLTMNPGAMLACEEAQMKSAVDKYKRAMGVQLSPQKGISLNGADKPEDLAVPELTGVPVGGAVQLSVEEMKARREALDRSRGM